MSDVMAYLAARSLSGASADGGGAGPMVRPRLPSRYETEALAPARPDDTEQVDGPRDDAWPVRAPAPPPRLEADAVPQQQRIEPPRPAGPPIAVVERLVTKRAVPAGRTETGENRLAEPPPAPGTRRPLRPEPEEGEAQPSPASLASAPIEPPARLRSPEVAQDARPSLSPLPPAPSEAAPAPNSRDDEAAIMAPRALQPPPKPELPPVAAAIRVIPAVAPPAKPPRQSARLPGVAESNSAALPAVQVTIGRLEIRAATAPPPVAPRPAPRARSMSLDDYLTHRGKG